MTNIDYDGKLKRLNTDSHAGWKALNDYQHGIRAASTHIRDQWTQLSNDTLHLYFSEEFAVGYLSVWSTHIPDSPPTEVRHIYYLHDIFKHRGGA